MHTRVYIQFNIMYVYTNAMLPIQPMPVRLVPHRNIGSAIKLSLAKRTRLLRNVNRNLGIVCWKHGTLLERQLDCGRYLTIEPKQHQRNCCDYADLMRKKKPANEK